MDASIAVAEYFNAVIAQCNRNPSGRPHNLPWHDQIIYYVVSTRCEMDMNGFDSVFDQLLTENELGLLVEALNDLRLPQLAASFDDARSRLRNAGFFDDDSIMVSDLENDEIEFLADIEEVIRSNDSLWNLDDRLAALIDAKA